MSKTLYKYRGLNNNTKTILLNKEIWYASIPSLNDPNEGLVKEITTKNAEDFVRKTMESQLAGFVFSLNMRRDIPENKRILKKIKNLESIEQKYRYMTSIFKKNGRRLSDAEGFLDSIDTMIKNVGVLSLSDNPANTLMWSHYGDNHKGIAIGISDFIDEAYQPLKYVQPSEIPEINFKEYISVLKMYRDYNSLEIGFNDSSLQAALQTKTQEWSYEGEWRGVKESYGLYPLDGRISEIIFGIKCSENERNEIREIISKGNHGDVSFKEVFRHPNSYELAIRDCAETSSSKNKSV